MFIIKFIFLSAVLTLPAYLWTDIAPWLVQLITDKVMHAHIGAGIASGIILGLHYSTSTNTLWICLAAITGVIALAITWELFELYLWLSQNTVLGIHMNGNPAVDYIQDLLVGIGAGVGIALYYQYYSSRA